MSNIDTLIAAHGAHRIADLASAHIAGCYDLRMLGFEIETLADVLRISRAAYEAMSDSARDAYDRETRVALVAIGPAKHGVRSLAVARAWARR